MSDPLAPDAGSPGEDSDDGGGTDWRHESKSPNTSAGPSTHPAEPSGGPPRTDRGTTGSGVRDSDAVQFLLDVISSVLVVGMIGVFLFTASGVWPPLVAIESGSMEPHIQEGDLVFVMEQHRFAGPGAHGGTGIVTARAGQQTGYRTFHGYGDVIVYHPDGNEQATPIIHRAMFWVEDEENWYDRADPAYRGPAENCRQLRNCPAPHAGFITKGDHNEHYDQVLGGVSGPVKPAWVMGTAEVRVPILGQVRLASGNANESAR